jgi:hypothetical protein
VWSSVTTTHRTDEEKTDRGHNKKKERQKDRDRSIQSKCVESEIQSKCVESEQACVKYKASCNVDMDSDMANLNVQALSYAGLK